MPWPWHFVHLSSDEKDHRRRLLDQYAVYSQVSILVPILSYQVYRLIAWVLSKKGRAHVAYTALGQSPVRLESARGWSRTAARRWRSTVWWLNGEISPDLGVGGRWTAAVAWTCWLLFLSVNQTGDDYFHVTKRFGSIAAAQLPIHYMLSMRNRYSPLAVIFCTSHEQLIHWHQICGRIIMILIALHGTLYINYFVQTGILVERLQTRPSMTGLLCLVLMSVLTITSIEKCRQWSYRAFYFCHLAIGLVILPILFFHTSQLRLYVIETLALFIADRILRRIDTIADSVTVTQIPATDLLKVQVHIPASKLSRFKTKPGQHVYMCISTGGGCIGANRVLSNPFTVADVSAGKLTLFLRTRRGPTTQMLLTHADRFNAQPLINIEGPYGTSVDIADVAGKFDRILLVAGGIGATFVLPVYRALREHLDNDVGGHKRLDFTWALRSMAEVAWATKLENQVFADNPDVHIYLTRQASLEHSFPEGMEMGDLRESDGLVAGSNPHMGRPNLRKIVDQAFSYHSEESVAVFFCGPHDMGRELRAHVGRWVAKGRSVFWRQESFGS
ncbi:unnamed protein product [Penicillium nalgiovense]|uniref:FAD-binding FR-type domain-containing protein n=1 Tax=Penicillium nalgiovense TaxID=60175 RepID=A0A9W4IIR1_PENNA|nr:unnamed protein product [Penicillium nalgiovense]CAG7984961.1 unnamed protein product [Penicillium nalgiovense]CAG7986042.1 unnamed protein product [Penicillium nalgiovense]CAG7986651.1 unnamed protein product [Penicillium nalgiovense]CAG7988092.1 unnamed protein product [Penicillium nalgiovense]